MILLVFIIECYQSITKPNFTETEARRCFKLDLFFLTSVNVDPGRQVGLVQHSAVAVGVEQRLGLGQADGPGDRLQVSSGARPTQTGLCEVGHTPQ